MSTSIYLPRIPKIPVSITLANMAICLLYNFSSR
uniref:Uncharacterized protein n=1 Tax=Romanomermis culicivorax TaxID=13658 RepID=A0A915KLY2_ROMCU